MAAPPSVDLSGWRTEHLEQASPDLLRATLDSLGWTRIEGPRVLRDSGVVYRYVSSSKLDVDVRFQRKDPLPAGQWSYREGEAVRGIPYTRSRLPTGAFRYSSMQRTVTWPRLGSHGRRRHTRCWDMPRLPLREQQSGVFSSSLRPCLSGSSRPRLSGSSLMAPVVVSWIWLPSIFLVTGQRPSLPSKRRGALGQRVDGMPGAVCGKAIDPRTAVPPNARWSQLISRIRRPLDMSADSRFAVSCRRRCVQFMADV